MVLGDRRRHPGGGVRLKRLLLLVLLLPLASAEVEEGVQRYTIDTHSVNQGGMGNGDIFDRTVVVQNYTKLPVNQTNIIIEITYTVQIIYDNAGIWSFTAYWDNTPICGWSIESFGALTSASITPHYTHHCMVEDVAFGNRAFRVTRTTATGTPGDIQFESLSYKITQEDLLEPVMSIDINTSLDAFVPFIVLGAAFFYGAWRGWFGVVLFAALGLVPHIFDTSLGISLGAAVVWIMIVIILEMLFKTERFTQRYALRPRRNTT